MKLNFNNTNLSQETSMPHTTNSSLDLTSTKLKIWWQGLPQEEKQKVCRLDTPSVMSDIANAANNALVVCKLNHTYKKKDLISWTKSKNQDAEVVSQTFEFSFVGKEILEDCLAELFSCFYIFIARCRKTEEFSDNERQSCQAEPKSHIGVNEERLDSLLDFLSHSLCDLSENRNSLLQKKDVSELYFSLIKDLSQKTMFNNNPTLHAYMKALLERLAVYSFLLEHQIYAAYFETALQEQERVEQSVLSQLSKLTPLATTTPLITKTVTQLEKECSAHELSVDQNSTASGSPRNPIVLGNPQNLNLEELSQKLLQKSPKDNGAGSMTRELSEPPSEMKPKLHEEFFPQNYSHRKNSAIPMWNESFDANMFTYEGCLVGNLQIPFDITDQVLSEEENEQQSETAEEEPRDFGIIEYDDIFGFGEQQEEQPEEAEKEEALLSNMSSFSVMSNPMMNFQSAYTVQQNYLYAGQDYYSPYSVQQNYSMMPYNYTVPMMYMTSPNNMDSVNGENLNYSIYSQRQKEYESQVSYDNDNSYYQTQKFSEHYNKVEYEGHHQAGQTDEKSYYIARDKPKYEVRPKLPPRLQKRKENMVRT